MAEISWLCGWFNILGQVADLASTEYGCAQLLLAAVALNSMNTKFLERMTRGYVIFHIGQPSSVSSLFYQQSGRLLLRMCISLSLVC
jgi:hypothetical protein